MSGDADLQVLIDRDNSIIELRQSAIQRFLDCRRAFYWEYVQGLEPDYPEGPRPWVKSRDTGSAFHAGIGAYYLGEDPLVAAWQWVNTEFGGIPDDADMDLVDIMLTGHINDLQLDGADVGETTIGVEVPVVAEIPDVRHWTVRVHGRVDRLIETDDGLKIIDDWKGVDKLDSSLNYIQQLGRYAVLVRQGSDWRADRVRSTQVRRVKRTKDGPFYSRPWLPMNEDAYRNHAINLRATLEDITRCIETDGPWYEHVTTECDWKCHVNSICQAQQHGDDPEMLVQIHYRKKEA